MEKIARKRKGLQKGREVIPQDIGHKPYSTSKIFIILI
jgi:hypothetical protein